MPETAGKATLKHSLGGSFICNYSSANIMALLKRFQISKITDIFSSSGG